MESEPPLQNIGKKYKVILADPPWGFDTYSDVGQVPATGSAPYKTMTCEEICNLPIDEITDDECVLFIWVTFPTIEQGFKVIESWGFKYKTCAFNWVKMSKNKPYIGLGFWTRSNSELCLLATKKKFPKRINADVSQVILSSVREHSRKPDQTYTRIERLLGDIPRIELFARTKRQGWDAWGNQVPKEQQNILTNS